MNNGGAFNVFEVEGKYNVEGDILTIDYSMSYDDSEESYNLEFIGEDLMKAILSYYVDEDESQVEYYLQEFEKIT